MIWSLLKQPWPWYVSGPLIGLFVPLLLLLGNKPFGVSSSMRALCAAIAPRQVEFFRYDWKHAGLWNIALAFGILVGGLLAVTVFGGGATPTLSPHTHDALTAVGLTPAAGLVPVQLFSWKALFTPLGATCVLGGGFLVGFGTSYAGGCTSGHGIMGLATLQTASVIALAGIFAGGLLSTYALIPLLLKLL